MGVGVDMALMAVLDSCRRKPRVWRPSDLCQCYLRNSLDKAAEEEAHGPKSDGVAPPGSLGGGGRLMRVGPEGLDIILNSSPI